MSYPVSLMEKLLSLQEDGKRLVDAGELREAFNSIFGCNGSVAAGTTALGPILTEAINNVISGTFLQLPAAIMGTRVTVIANSTANLFISAAPINPANGGAADQVNGASNVMQATGEASVYVCYQLGQWVQIGGAVP